MPQRLVFNLIEQIRPFANPTGEIVLEIQILSVLNFLASGSYQVYVDIICFFFRRLKTLIFPLK